MKRIFALTLAVLIIALSVLSCASCGKKHICDFCEEERKCIEKDLWGETIYICEDCMDDLNDFNS